MILKYEVKFLDYWHLSSGLSAGARLDSTVVKTSNSLPYIPGKTIKGLLREMAELLDEDNTFVKECFGTEKIDSEGCYFSNSTLDDGTAQEIVDHHLQDNLYDVIISTKIGEKDNEQEIEGLAVDGSLREIEVVIPLTLNGEIKDLPQNYEDKMKIALAMIKRMGLNRNRGLGRCEVTIRGVE